MSLIKCNECGNEISSKAKDCPNCGAPIEQKKKGVGFFGWAFALLVLYGIFSVVGSDNNKSTSQASKLSVSHEKALSYFKSNEEKTVKDAVWGSSTKFKVGVFNDGTNRDGFAKYVCNVLTGKFNISSSSLHVGVFDIAKIANQGKWDKIGGHYCSDK